MGSVVAAKRGRKFNVCHLPPRQQPEFMLARRNRGAGSFDDEHPVQFLDELLCREPVQVLQHAVVRQDLHLLVREDDAEELAALPRAVARLENARRRRAAMMSIGDVKSGDACEFVLDEFDLRRVADDPRSVPHAVRRGEIHIRLLGCFFASEFVKGRLGAVGQEYRAGLGIQRLNVPDAVILFVGPREFVFLDDVLQIFLATGRGHQAHLRMLDHDLAIEIKAGRRVLSQRALRDQLLEILAALGVNLRRVKIRAGRQIDFRFAHVQKTERIGRRDGARLIRRHDIVR